MTVRNESGSKVVCIELERGLHGELGHAVAIVNGKPVDIPMSNDFCFERAFLNGLGEDSSPQACVEMRNLGKSLMEGFLKDLLYDKFPLFGELERFGSKDRAPIMQPSPAISEAFRAMKDMMNQDDKHGGLRIFQNNTDHRASQHFSGLSEDTILFEGDVAIPGAPPDKRGVARLVVAADLVGSKYKPVAAFYSSDHYETFTKVNISKA